MTGHNLTRSQAAARSRAIEVSAYDISLNLAAVATSPTFPSRTTIEFSVRSDADEAARSKVWFDLIAPQVRRITLDGTDLDIAAFDGFRISLPLMDIGTHSLEVEADCSYMTTGEGLHRFVDPVDNEAYLYTQFEVADARRVFVCADQPDLKATYTFTVDAPSHWRVISNAATPEPTPVSENTSRWAFPTTARISTYITAVVAGPYHQVFDSYTGTYGTYPMSLLCRASLAEFLDHEEIFTVTKQGFELFESDFATGYPFGKYDQAFVPEFNAGAMENAGCVTHHEDLVFRSRVTMAAYEVRANTVLHELAHMWFGDLVTMTWWDDLWLNESFAEWAAHYANAKATRYTDAWTTFLNQRKTWGYRQDQLPSTHPIVADMVDLEAVQVNFDGITYAKGASALRQLVAWVGQEEFIAGLRNYFTKHAWGNTQLKDLLVELEASSGRDLSTWSAQWLETSGVNLLRPVIEVDESGRYTSVAVTQEPPASPEGIAPTLRSHRIGVGLYRLRDGALVLDERFEIDVEGESTEIAALVGVEQPDLLLLNDGDLSFAKIRLDERSIKTAVASFAAMEDSLARALIWGAAWDMTRDAEMSAGDYVDLAISGLRREGDIGVVSMTVRQLGSVIEQFAAPANRDAYRDRIALAFKDYAIAAEAGSDHQLAFLRGFMANARSSEDQRWLTALLDGSEKVEGLAVDADLRWSIVTRLVALGASEALIDDELTRDDTATGRRHAALARAARPTVEAKDSAWAAAVEGDELSNAILGATVGGFNQPDQRDLLRPFVDKYVAALPGIWSDRTYETASTLTMGLFPASLVEPATIAAADALLANEALAPGGRRLVGELRDGVQRAARAQQVDATRTS